MDKLRLLVKRARALRLPPRVIVTARRTGALAAVGLVSYVLWSAGHGLDISRLHPLPLAGALGFALIAWGSLALGWSQLSPLPTRRSSIGSWCRSQVLRYLPGVGWAQAARATTVQTSTAGKVTAVIVESAATLAVALAVGGILYATGNDAMWYLAVLAPLGMAAGAFVLGSRLDLPPVRVFGAMGAYTVSWVAYGISTVFSQHAVGGVITVPTLTIAGAGVLAWSFGFLTVITPGGVGARELAYVALLTYAMPQSQLAAAALVNRVASTVAELVVLVAVLLGRRWVSAQRSRISENASILLGEEAVVLSVGTAANVVGGSSEDLMKT